VVLLELAGILRIPTQKRPPASPANQEEFPDTTNADQADRVWRTLAEILIAPHIRIRADQPEYDGAAHRTSSHTCSWVMRAEPVPRRRYPSRPILTAVPTRVTATHHSFPRFFAA